MAGDGTQTGSIDVVCDVLREVRKAKSDARVSMRTEAELVEVVDSAQRLKWLSAVQSDLYDAGRIRQLDSRTGAVFSVTVTLV